MKTKSKGDPIPRHVNSRLRRCIRVLLLLLCFAPSASYLLAQDEDRQLNEILESLDRGESIVGKRIDLRNINFETGKSNLDPGSEQYLGKLVAFLSKVPNINLTITGHTDTVGKATDNQRLSLERAEAVRDFFVAGGIPGDRLGVAGFGSSKPLASNASEEGRRLNRRVELEVYSLVENVVAAQDVIYFRNGEKVGAVYIIIRGDSIEYQSFANNLVYHIPSSDVRSVNYANGTSRTFEAPVKKSEPVNKVNPRATEPLDNYAFQEFGFWFEYFRGSRIRSRNFEDIDISDWESTGLMSANPNNSEGRVRLPLSEQTFSEATHGLDIGILVGITERVGALAEWQTTGSASTSVRSYMVGASYDLLMSDALCLAAVAKTGLTKQTINLGTVRTLSGYYTPTTYGSEMDWYGSYLSAKTAKMAYQVGVRGDFRLRHEEVRLNFQLGIGGNLFGSTRFLATPAGYTCDPVKLRFRDPSAVKPNGGSTPTDTRPKIGTMGVYFAIGYSGFFGKKRESLY